MNHDIDLDTASRESLLALIGRQHGLIEEQQALIVQLQRRVEDLERKAGPGGPKGMPGNKPQSQQKSDQPKEPRKTRRQGFGRQRMTPTRWVDHALENCPDCGATLTGGWVQRTREVIDIPQTPVQVTQHRYVARNCPTCRKRRLPQADLKGEALGQQRLGINLLSLIASLREAGRLPLRTIQWYLDTVHHLSLSLGAITRALHQVAQRGEPLAQNILEGIRGSPVVHADETGWRQDGVNGYVWTFSTPTQRYFLRRGRNKEVVDEVLGEEFNGVLVSDFYAAYHHYPGLKQRCWVHLLRDIHDLKSLYPQDVPLARWAAKVHRIYTQAKAFAHPDEKKRSLAQHRLEQKLLVCCRPYLEDPSAPQRKLCRRITDFIKELFTFVTHPHVPSDNNAAERSLRPLVVSRKISGGTRSEQGTQSKLTLATLFRTWQAQKLNPLLTCHQLLASP